MKKIVAGALCALMLVAAAGCRRKIDGPRIWWDDQNREPMPDSYQLPEDLRAGTERDPGMTYSETYGLSGL